MGRHSFNPLPPRVAVYEVITTFVAATAVGLAAQFNGDLTAPGWLLYTMLLAAPLLFSGSVVWLACAYKRHSLIEAGRAVSNGRYNVESPLWRWLGITATLALIAVTVTATALAVRSDPEFSSAYDGRDPEESGCVDSAVTSPIGKDGPRILDSNERDIGRLEMRASPLCGTVWARAELNPDVAPELRGGQIILAVYRPADDVRKKYPLRLNGGSYGYSNMISAIDTCVIAEAMYTNAGKDGPLTRTTCVEDPW
ncbi:hypothetical protein ACN27J_33105 [Solwaraspora sp. WMMB762]|uniref:hypothetical protein n=1 Tax=Solwaraspora sp. WMMB762 TaxID=3404120 RepID=UPI003B966A85